MATHKDSTPNQQVLIFLYSVGAPRQVKMSYTACSHYGSPLRLNRDFVSSKLPLVTTVTSLKSDRFSVYFIVSALLAIWVTHSSVKLNVKHIFFSENKNTCCQRQSILLKTHFYLDHNSLQFMQDYFKSKLTSS